jgi:hypothetical protein
MLTGTQEAGVLGSSTRVHSVVSVTVAACGHATAYPLSPCAREGEACSQSTKTNTGAHTHTSHRQAARPTSARPSSTSIAVMITGGSASQTGSTIPVLTTAPTIAAPAPGSHAQTPGAPRVLAKPAAFHQRHKRPISSTAQTKTPPFRRIPGSSATWESRHTGRTHLLAESPRCASQGQVEEHWTAVVAPWTARFPVPSMGFSQAKRGTPGKGYRGANPGREGDNAPSSSNCLLFTSSRIHGLCGRSRAHTYIPYQLSPLSRVRSGPHRRHSRPSDHRDLPPPGMITTMCRLGHHSVA